MHLSSRVAYDAVLSKAVVVMLLICCFIYVQLFAGALCWSLFCYALLCVLHSFAIILDEEERAGCFALIDFCLVTVLWLFLAMPPVCLQCVIVVYPDHTRLLFAFYFYVLYN